MGTMQLTALTLLVASCAFCAASPITTTTNEDPCCVGQCDATAGLEKYWSIASSIFGTKHCGECCMSPSDYKLYHFFESNLTKSDVDYPCKSFGFTKYDLTTTHGFGPISMTLDLYNEPSGSENSEGYRKTSAADDPCPGSSAWVHAKTQVTATFTDSCDEVA